MNNEFNNLFNNTRDKYDKILSFTITPGEYNSLKELFYYFYKEGEKSFKEQSINELTEKMNSINDSVPKTLYPSEKYKSAIKLIQNINI